MRKKIINLVFILVILIFLFYFISNLQNKNTGQEQQKQVNSKEQNYSNKNEATIHAYDFNLKSINGGNIKLSDYLGKVVILNFWATWCPPCKAEIPSFIELYKKYEKDGLVIIGAAIDDEYKVKNFVKSFNINYPVAIADITTTEKYGGIRGIPSTFIIDKEGKIIKSYMGYRPKEIFENDFLNLK